MTLTLAVTAVFAALTLLFGWLGARPPNPHRGPRMVPWRFLMLLGVCGVLLGLVHVVNLLGVTTGRP